MISTKNIDEIQTYLVRKKSESKHLNGQLDPPVGDVPFFNQKEVSWIPQSMM